MKRVISNTETPTEVVTIDNVFTAGSTTYVGYETEGGLRAMLTGLDSRYGFKYYDPDSTSNGSLKFVANSKEGAIRNAHRAGRGLITTTNPSEFAQWYTSADQTVSGYDGPIDRIEHIMRNNNVSLDELATAMIKHNCWTSLSYITHCMNKWNVPLRNVVEAAYMQNLNRHQRRQIVESLREWVEIKLG